MNLRETGIREKGPALVAPPGRRHVATFGVGREIIGVAVPPRAQQHRVSRVRFDLTIDEISADDSSGKPVDDDQVEHLAAGKQPDFSVIDLPHQRPVRAQKKLLARLPAGVKRARNEHAAECPVAEHTSVFTGERHPLGDALINDVAAQLSEAIDISFTAAKIAPLDGVVKQSPHAVAVVLIVLGGVDPALCRNAVRAAGRVLKAERLHIVTQLGQ